MTDPAHDPAHAQVDHRVRLEWGPTGAAAVAAGATLAVVVDVLSFTTTLSVALDRGVTVFPYRWHGVATDDRAAAYAAERDAVLAVGRLEARGTTGQVSLSPASFAALSGTERVVLPSPNGSAIAFALAGTGATVVGACLRNAGAVARWLAHRLGRTDVLAVVAAGERWPDGSLRPAVEDLWGAGAVLAALVELGVDGLGPEARLAVDAFTSARDSPSGLAACVTGCASGRELVGAGFADDVAIAAALDVSTVVPVLQGEAFRAAPSRPATSG